MGAKIVVATNILISALGWQGLEYRLISDCLSGVHSLCLSNQIISELSRVMDYPKFGFSREQKQLFLDILHHCASIIDISPFLGPICADSTDLKFLECALVHKADFLLSGDQHLVSLVMH